MVQPCGSEGVYFVVRLPERWELIAFRFDEHPEGGHPEFWETLVAPRLAKAWTPELFASLTADERSRREQRLQAELALHYDGFPRGRVTWVEEFERFAIYHGRNLTRGMKLRRSAVERAFGIEGVAHWEFDEHEQCSAFSADGLRSALRLREQWKTAEADFD